MAATFAFLKEPEGLRYNGVAIVYAVVGYGFGIAGLFNSSWLVSIPATLLLAHAMTIAAYLIHESGHNLIFRRSQHNAALGSFMSWICGAAYGTYEDMRYKHFRHHVDNDDVVWFEYDKFFEKHRLVLRTARGLEWFYVPAHDLIMHFIMVFTSFIIPARRDQRARNLKVIAIRGSAYLALLVFFTKVAVLYWIAYMTMVQILRFMDMLQHDYPYNATLFDYADPPHKGDHKWEQAHTFSNPVSLKYARLNWLTLNFGYHNAHHADMNLPWYRLPAMHRNLTGDDPELVIPFAAQLKLFHRNRVLRVFNPQPDGYPQRANYLRAARAGSGAVGGNAASFLTSF